METLDRALQALKRLGISEYDPGAPNMIRVFQDELNDHAKEAMADAFRQSIVEAEKKREIFMTKDDVAEATSEGWDNWHILKVRKQMRNEISKALNKLLEPSVSGNLQKHSRRMGDG